MGICCLSKPYLSEDINLIKEYLKNESTFLKNEIDKYNSIELDDTKNIEELEKYVLLNTINSNVSKLINIVNQISKLTKNESNNKLTEEISNNKINKSNKLEKIKEINIILKEYEEAKNNKFNKPSIDNFITLMKKID